MVAIPGPCAKIHSMDSGFTIFQDTYHRLLPGALRAFLTEDDLKHFIGERFHFIRNRETDLKIEISEPTENQPWLINSTIIQVCLPDSPFITDTILDYLNSEGHRIHLSLPALFSITRQSGLVQDLQLAAGQENTEAYVYVEIERLNEDERNRVYTDLQRNLQELCQVVQDFPVALDRLRAMEFGHNDLQGDRDWIADNFVTLGSARYDGAGLADATGLLREDSLREQAEADLSNLFLSRSISFERFKNQGADRGPGESPEILFHESGIMSRVNRHRALHLILVPGDPAFLLAGHFAGRGELTPRFLNPPARRKVEKLAEKIYAPVNSHRRKLLFQIAQMIPVGILLSRPQPLVEQWLTQILDNLYVEEPDFSVDSDPEYEMIWILGVVAGSEASAFSSEHINRVGHREGFQPDVLLRRRMNEHEILLLSIVPTGGQTLEALFQRLSKTVHGLFASWQNQFRKSLTNHFIGERVIEEKLTLYRQALSPAAEVQQEPEEALQDLIRLEDLTVDRPVRVNFHRKQNDVYVKIYSMDQRPIGDLVPMLAHFGFLVTDEYAFPTRFASDTRYIYAYRIEDAELNPRFDASVSRVLEEVVLGTTTDESLNRMAIYGLDRHQLALVKTLLAYLFQIDRTFSRAFIARTTLAQKDFVRTLVQWFMLRFSPEEASIEREQSQKELTERLQNQLDAIGSIMEAQLCRRLFQIVEAVVRSNYYSFKPEVSFKIRSQQLTGLLPPVPLFEIFVYSSEFEAVHLRGAMIARGGIRWSDRPDDFRTEIHGLMKAQMVKNTVIVPSGSKGGFCLKGSRATDPAFALQCYKRFMASMLELTDNRTPDDEIEAPDLVCLDPPDPYLVVAADKGTARFSDDANEVAMAAGFWLGDAFASGGTNGYDHKKQGITARGAWESVRRHFFEMAQDPEKDPVTVAAIGDMGGDVFGNGMLLSRSMRLVAAFNHRHIFLDPAPSPEAWQERKRLFDEVLGWDAYNASLLSKGGGIYDRTSARIRLSPEAAEALGIEESELSGEELIRSILSAPVDLLWNGGIGTYVKASTETHDDAMDPANDRVRINGNEMRCRVIGEGGNLGFTQKARLEAAANGTRLNTDAIDNSGGVDMSDHEVNLKILLERLMRTERMDPSGRNQWIEKLEEDMIELVLLNNRASNLCLSLDQRRVQLNPEGFTAVARWLENRGHRLEGLALEDPSSRFEQPSRSFSRPMLASMLGHAKLELKNQILDSGGFSRKEMESYFTSYFPEKLLSSFPDDVLAHPLRQEITVAQVLNHCVQYGGVTFFLSVMEKTGSSPVDVAYARLSVESFLDVSSLRSKAPGAAAAETDYLISLEDRIERMTITALLQNAAEALFSGSQGNRQMFSEVLEYLRAADPEEKAVSGGPGPMDLALWYCLNSGENSSRSMLEQYRNTIRMESIRSVDTYLARPVSASVADMRFYRRIQERRDNLVHGLIRGQIKEDSLNDFRAMLEGEDAKSSTVIFEALESVQDNRQALQSQ
jgi:glutamate dehydrogenase